jgi:predicted aspartyl protease
MSKSFCFFFQKEALFASLISLLLAAAPAQATCTLGHVATVPLTVTDGRAIIEMSVNDHPGKFELDTGAEDTILQSDYALASHVGLDRHAGQLTLVGAGGRQTLPIWRAHVRQTEIGELKFSDWEYPVLNGRLPSPVPIDGLLGADFLHYFDIELDAPAGKMSLWRLSGCTDIEPPWHGTHDAIELKPTKGGQASMPIWIDNAFLDVLLDTGAGGLLLTRDAANRAGATDAQLAADKAAQASGVGGGFTATGHAFKTLLIGSAEFDRPTIDVDANFNRAAGEAYSGRDGILGLGYFKADKIWISFTTHTLFLQSAEQANTKPK